MNTKYTMLMSSKILYSYLWIRDMSAIRDDIVIFDSFYLVFLTILNLYILFKAFN